MKGDEKNSQNFFFLRENGKDGLGIKDWEYKGVEIECKKERRIFEIKMISFGRFIEAGKSYKLILE